MTLFLGVILASVGAGYLLGGRLRRFEGLYLRWWALAPIGFGMQLLTVPGLRGDAERLASVGLLIASYPLLLVFVVANRRLPGFPLLFVGLALNLVVIAANGGMPVARHALIASDQADSLRLLIHGAGAKHHLLGSGDVLRPLADVIAVGRPIRQVMSVGDVLVYAAVAWLIVSIMRGRTPQPAPASRTQRYQGKHRPRAAGETAEAQIPPAAATKWGSGP